MDFFVDQHIGTRDTQYYLAMANIEHFSLTSYARLLASRYIDDAWLAIRFVTELENFANRCVEQIRTAREIDTCKFILDSMKRENASLHKQDMMLISGEAKLSVTATFKKHEKTIGYIIDGIGIIVGGIQVIGGIAILAGSIATGNVIGVVVGATIFLNGVNSLQETVQKIQGVEQPVGSVRGAFMNTAEFLGFDRQVGDFVFQGVDLATSIYGVSRFILKPDTWRLFYYIPQNFQRKVNTMSKAELTLKVAGVGNKLHVMAETSANRDGNYKR